MDKKEILLSVIVPVYNAENNIENCIWSICNQSYKNIEIIAVDDGSKDLSYSKLQKLAQNDERIRVITQDNRGVSSARNVGLSNSKGEYVTFVDADDFIEENGYEIILEKMNATNSDVAIYAFSRDYKDSSEIDLLPWNNGTVLEKEEILKSLVPQMISAKRGIQNISGSVCRSVFRRTAVQDLTFDEAVRIQEDLIFCIYAYARANKILIMNGVKYHYIKHESTTTEHFRKDYYKESLAFEDKIIEALITVGIFDEIKDRYWSKRITMYSLCVSNLFRKDAPADVDNDLKSIINGFRKDAYITNRFNLKYVDKLKLAIFILFKFGTLRMISKIYSKKEARRQNSLSV